jgi:glycosyltransferase involved in cell wall biosynthesis
MGLSVAIPAKNEERYIAGCLESVQGLADEVLVILDPETQDRTAAICREKGARLEVVPFVSFARLRNRALELCQYNWVFFLDADERATEELRQEVRAVTAVEPDPNDSQAVVGYWIPRHNYFFGRPVRHAGWYPDHQLRLMWRERAHYPEEQKVHEVVRLQGKAGYLAGHLLHHNVDTPAEFRAKQRRYAHLEAASLWEKGVRARPRHLLTRPLREFWRRYISLAGWKDGLLGLYLCAAMGYYTFCTYRILLRRQRAGPPLPSHQETPSS